MFEVMLLIAVSLPHLCVPPNVALGNRQAALHARNQLNILESSTGLYTAVTNYNNSNKVDIRRDT